MTDVMGQGGYGVDDIFDDCLAECGAPQGGTIDDILGNDCMYQCTCDFVELAGETCGAPTAATVGDAVDTCSSLDSCYHFGFDYGDCIEETVSPAHEEWQRERDRLRSQIDACTLDCCTQSPPPEDDLGPGHISTIVAREAFDCQLNADDAQCSDWDAYCEMIADQV